MRRRRSLVLIGLVVASLASCGTEDLFHSLQPGDCVQEKSEGGIMVEGELRRIDCSQVAASSDPRTYVVQASGSVDSVNAACPTWLFHGFVVVDGGFAVCFGTGDTPAGPETTTTATTTTVPPESIKGWVAELTLDETTPADVVSAGLSLISDALARDFPGLDADVRADGASVSIAFPASPGIDADAVLSAAERVFAPSVGLAFRPVLEVSPTSSPDSSDGPVGSLYGDVWLADRDGVVYHLGPARLVAGDVVSVRAVANGQGLDSWHIELGLTTEGTVKFTEFTKELAAYGPFDPRRSLAICGNGLVISAPQISPDISPEVGIVSDTVVIGLASGGSADAAQLEAALRFAISPPDITATSLAALTDP